MDPVDDNNVGRFPENQAPSTLNDGARALEGIVARWHRDTNGSLRAGGTANSLTVAANQTLTAYYDGLTITFTADADNTGPAFLDVDSISSDQILWPDGSPLDPDDLQANGKYTVRHNGSVNWILVSSTQPASISGRIESPVTLAGPSITFSGIPSWAKEIVGSLLNISTNGTSGIHVQIGDSGGIETTGYLGTATSIGQTSLTSGLYAGAGFEISDSWNAVNVAHGAFRLSLIDATNDDWAFSSTIGYSNSDGTAVSGGSNQSLSGNLTQVRFITINGTDTLSGKIGLQIR